MTLEKDTKDIPNKKIEVKINRFIACRIWTCKMVEDKTQSDFQTDLHEN
jgi:hypothetical protein